MGSYLDSLDRFLGNHHSEVIVALALVVLAQAAIVWLWARRVSRMRHRLAEAEAAAGTAASAAAAALAVDSLYPPGPLEPAATSPAEPATGSPPLETVAGPQGTPAAGDPGVAGWAVEAAAQLSPVAPAEPPAAAPEPVAPWIESQRARQPVAAPAATLEPADGSAAAPAREPVAVHAAPPGEAEPAGGRLLLVEDDVNVAKLYRMLLESRGYAVRHASDGIEGLDAVRRERPDLILLDVMMPRMNGITLLQTIRDDPALSDVPAVVLSNFREPRLVERAMALGALEYMVKAQTRPETLIGAIPHWLRGERAVDL